MRIGVNLVPLVPGVVGGIKQHVLGLLNGLLEVDQDHSYVFFINKYLKQEFPQDDPRIRIVETSFYANEIESRYLQGEFDVLFAPLMNPGVDKPVFPMVTLLVDLQHLTFPQYFSKHELSFRHLHWEWPARAAQSVCVSSEYVADSLQKHLGIPRSRILFTPPPTGRWFLQEPTNASIEKFDHDVGSRLQKKFLLYPSNTWPHKNHLRLLSALSNLRHTHPDIHMVFTGWPQKAHKNIKSAIRKQQLENSVSWLGYLPDEWMPLVYRRANGLVFPSLYEGFGIPLLEAMHCDCPIACSNTTSCPEVAGDAAIYFNPEAVPEIESAMETLWDDGETTNRLIEKGREQRTRFDRNNQHLDLLHAILSAPGRFTNPWKWKNQHYPSRPIPSPSPLVSIIIPSFQQGRFIRAAIESVLGQEYQNIECIVMDGGSTDETVDILKSFGNSITWVSEPDQGQAHAINKGIAMSSGSIIGWLNSDDLYKPNAVTHAVTALSGDSGCWLVYGEGDYIDEQGNYIGRYPTDTYCVSNLLRHCCICQPSVFFHRRLYDMGGKLNEELHMALDYELWLRYSKFTPLLYIPEVLASSRVYPETKTSLYHLQSIKESMSACRKHYGTTSPLWCRQYARALSEKIPVFGRRRKLRLPFQAAILLIALLVNLVPNQLKTMARDLLRASK